MLLEEITGLVYFDIMEMLERKFDDIEWEVEGNEVIGVGAVDGIDVQVRLSAITYYNEQGLNVVFALKDENGKFSERSGTFKNATVKQASSIIGAVANAVIQKLDDYDWSFVTMIAKDNIETRMKLYQRIAHRIKTTRKHPELYEFFGKVNGEGLVALVKKDASHILKKIESEADK